MSKPKIEGFEFTSDPKTVYVLYSATFMIQDVGPVSARVREPWNWDGKDWFLEIKDTGNPFAAAKAAPTSPPANTLPFELSIAKIDLGKHVQGEIVRRTIDFKSDQDRFGAFRHNELKGLQVTGPIWTSKQTGQLEVALDTTLLDAGVSYPVELEISGWQSPKTLAKFEVTAEIEPRLRFSQTPEIIDPATGGTIEIQIENLSNISFKPVSLVLTNTAYQVSDHTPGTIAPGKTLKLSISYQPQVNPLGVAVNVGTSPAVVVNPNFVVPLNVKLPVPHDFAYTKEEIDEMIKRTR